MKSVKEKFSFKSSKPVVAPVVPAVNATVAPSATPYNFSPDIQIFGSDAYKQKIQNALNEIKRTNTTEYNEVMLYLEKLYQFPPKDVKEGEGIGGFYIPEDQIYPGGLVHEKWHVIQANIEPFKSYYDSLGKDKGWRMELDAVKKQVSWEAEAYNYTAEQKQQKIKNYMDYYKDRYPEEYAKWISEN